MLNRSPKYGDIGLGIRVAYMEGFQNRSITAVVRAGDRGDQKDFKFLPMGIDIPVRFIKKIGDAFLVNMEFFPDDGTTVRCTGCIVKKIGELTVEDLQGTTPDTATSELVRYHLAIINNTPLPSLEDVVTIWRFEYRPKAIE